MQHVKNISAKAHLFLKKFLTNQTGNVKQQNQKTWKR